MFPSILKLNRRLQTNEAIPEVSERAGCLKVTKSLSTIKPELKLHSTRRHIESFIADSNKRVNKSEVT